MILACTVIFSTVVGSWTYSWRSPEFPVRDPQTCRDYAMGLWADRVTPNLVPIVEARR